MSHDDDEATVRGRSALPKGAWRLLPVAVSATGALMLLHFAAVAEVVLRMHAMSAEHTNAVKMRMSTFQRMRFPLPSRSRRKAKLGMEDSLKIVFAFELSETGIAASRAVRMASTDWLLIRDAIATAWSRIDAAPDDRDEHAVLAIAPRAMREMGASESVLELPLSETVGLLPVTALTDEAAGSRVLIAIDVGAMAVAFGEALAATGIASQEDFVRAMRVFCAEVFGTLEAQNWPGRVPSKKGRAKETT